MFKEFGLIFILFICVVALLRQIVKKDRMLCYKVVAICIVLTSIVSIIYNVRYVFPTFVYEGVPIGDNRENLFVYKSDSHFKWQVLNTVASNRKVLLDNEGEFYQKYFEIFSEEVEVLELSEEDRRLLLEEKQENQSLNIITLTMVEQLTYAFPTWNGKILPTLYLNEEGLQGCDTIVVAVEENDGSYDMIVVSENYYNYLLKKEEIK